MICGKTAKKEGGRRERTSKPDTNMTGGQRKWYSNISEANQSTEVTIHDIFIETQIHVTSS